MKAFDSGIHVANRAWMHLADGGKQRLVGISAPAARGCRWGMAISFLALALSVKPAAAQTPQINTVQFSGSAGNYTLTLAGTGFGNPAVSMPFTGDVGNFRIADSAQVGHGEWGYTGDGNGLAYKLWSNTTIVVSGFGGEPCDAITIAVWDSASGLAGTWGGNVPCSVSPPQITGVELSGTGASLQIVVHGTGFGSSPSTLPAPGTAGDTNYFWFLDFRTHCGSSSSLFEAGFDRWGVSAADSVSLYYESWSNDQIVISGFGGTYGTGCAIYQAGDPIAIVVYNSGDSNDKEPQTAWGGPAATGISISAMDLTTGKNIVSGSTITAGDTFEVTVTAAPEFNCAGQFVVTALGAAGAAPSVLVQDQLFIIGPAAGTTSVTGGVLTSNGIAGQENDWKISASCNGASPSSMAFSGLEFLSAVP